MVFDPKVYRNVKDGVGSPSDPKATSADDDNTAVALLKGVLDKLTTSGTNAAASVTGAAVPSGASYTAVNVSGTLRGWTGGALGSAVAGHVAIVDASGNQVTSFGGGTEYTEDAAAAANPSGNMLVAVRRDTLSASEVSADGDNIALKASNKGQLHVRDADADAILGGVTETAPATDTASSGLNGRLQRIAQRLTSFIALFPVGAGTAAAATRTTLASDDPAVVSVQIMDDWDESDRAKVNLIVGQAGITAGAGAVAANTPRVTHASDDPIVAATPNQGQVSTATLSTLASAATSAQLVAANAARKGLMLYNTDANGVYVKYGTTASATSFTVLIPASGYWEMPLPIYTGRIDAIWGADGSGSLFATEL